MALCHTAVTNWLLRHIEKYCVFARVKVLLLLFFIIVIIMFCIMW